MIAVIAALDEEIKAITSIMEEVEMFEKSGLQFYKGILMKHELLVMQSGVGKGNASMATTILLENFVVDRVINIGTAGGLKKEQQVLDAIISERVVQHDFDTSAVDGEEGIGLYFDADQDLAELCVQALLTLDVRVYRGLIASGDQFIARDEQLKILEERFPEAICAEMEAGAIAQICTHYHVPFVVLRSLSDVAHNKDSHMDFLTYVVQASKRSAAFCKEFMRISAR